MKIKTLKQIIIFIICIVFLLIAIQSSIIAADIEHLQHCHNHECAICMMIKNAITIIYNIGYIFIITIYMSLLSFIAFIISYFMKNTLVNIKKFSLIEYKIQHNE